MKRGGPPRLVLLPDRKGAAGSVADSATVGARPRTRTHLQLATIAPPAADPAPDELAEAAEALAALLRGLSPASVRGADEPSR